MQVTCKQSRIDVTFCSLCGFEWPAERAIQLAKHVLALKRLRSDRWKRLRDLIIQREAEGAAGLLRAVVAGRRRLRRLVEGPALRRLGGDAAPCLSICLSICPSVYLSVYACMYAYYV